MYVCLVFGRLSSPKICGTLSQKVCWIANNNYIIETKFHLLDDFLTVDRPDDCDEVWSISLLDLIFKTPSYSSSSAQMYQPYCLP